MTAPDLAKQLASLSGGVVGTPVEFRGEVTVKISDPQQTDAICFLAKNELGFDYLVDITSIDNFDEDPRFTVVYHLYGYAHHCHLRLKTHVGESAAELPTVTTVWKTADWHEREIYDMMGLRFRGHPDLRRILMWDGYPYFPLRKDFPLAGKPTELPDVAFTQPAPLEGGPFVTVSGGGDSRAREPRVRTPAGESPTSTEPARDSGDPRVGAQSRRRTA